MRAKIPFVGSSYQARSLNASAQRTVNCYVEYDQSSPRAPVALYGTPGTERRYQGTGATRGGVAEAGSTWWVIGQQVHQLSSSYEGVVIGTLDTLEGEVGMASNGAQILIVDGMAGWLIDVRTRSLIRITDDSFPNGVKRAAYQDGFFLVTGDNSGKFYINETPNDGLEWNGLDFASAEGSPDNTIGIISDHREVWLFGERSAEVWSNTGNPDFPFQRSSGVFIEHGCAAGGSVAKADNTVFWLGADDKGAGIVWRADGYTPIRISTHGMERVLSKYPRLDDAIAMTYQQEGHIWYVLTFPSADATWCYDAATKEWHEREWMDPADGTTHRWRPNCMVFANGEHLAGEFDEGVISAVALDLYTDNGGPIKRLRATSAQENMQGRVFYTALQVDMETGVGVEVGQGVNPQLVLRYSNDGGHTWSNEKTAALGKVGEYGARARFTRLGSGRNRVWEISCADPVKWAVFGAVLDLEGS